VLLLWKTLVDRDKGIEVAGHGIEQFAVISVAPTHLGCGADFVTGEAPAKALRDTGVEEDSHGDGRAG